MSCNQSSVSIKQITDFFINMNTVLLNNETAKKQTAFNF